jgi:hypothetical protein
MEYQKNKLKEFQTNSSIKKVDLHTDIHEFKKGYQPKSSIVKGRNCDLLTDSHNILNRSKNYFG